MSRGIKILSILDIKLSDHTYGDAVVDVEGPSTNSEGNELSLLNEALKHGFLIAPNVAVGSSTSNRIDQDTDKDDISYEASEPGPEQCFDNAGNGGLAALDVTEINVLTEGSNIGCSTINVDHVPSSNITTNVQLEKNNNEDEQRESDQDFVPSEEESEEGSANAENEEMMGLEGLMTNGEDEIPKRKKRKLSNVKRDSSYQANKRKRELGVPYNGKRKHDGSWEYKVEEPGKFLTNPCECRLSERKTVLECRKLSEQQRRALFTSFWKKSWQEKREYVRGLAKLQLVKRRRGETEESRRNYSVKYHLECGHVTYRVCKKMFNNTLGLKHNCNILWIKAGMVDEHTDEGQTDHRSQGKDRNPRQKESNLIRTGVTTFLNALSKVESHYCRVSTQRLYLEPIWQTKQDLYRFYVNSYWKERNVPPASRTTFNDEFQKLNLSLFRPRKDQCDTCVAYGSKNITEEAYQHHLLLKREARDEKNNDKMAQTSDFIFTMDMQSVLLAPKNKVGAMYYKTKLAVHNFTIYNIKSQEGYCYMWNETEGALTANEFSSIIVSFIEDEILPNRADKSGKIIFWSDGCSGQNRNACLSNALLNVSIIHQVTIIQKYLYKGHTQMEADSMHSAIERRIRNKDINVPADYVVHCENARHKPFPYKVRYLDHTFFRDFSQVKYVPSIRPGRQSGDPTVNDLKQLKYTPDSVIEDKLRHTDDWAQLSLRRSTKNTNQETKDMKQLPVLYRERRKIKKEKYEHLQILKNSLKPDYHAFYDEIPFTAT